MQYEEIEYFKRFAKCYLMWSHSNFDRMVSDIIKKDAEAEKQRKIKIVMANLPEYTGPVSTFNFDRDVRFGVLKINFPNHYFFQG